MTTLRNARTLTRYMAWANDKIYDVALSCVVRQRPPRPSTPSQRDQGSLRSRLV